MRTATSLLSKTITFLLLFSLLFIGQASSMLQVVASDTIQASNDTEYSTVSPWDYQLLSSIVVPNNITGSFKVSFDLKSSGIPTVYAKLIQNGVLYGTEQSTIIQCRYK